MVARSKSKSKKKKSGLKKKKSGSKKSAAKKACEKWIMHKAMHKWKRGKLKMGRSGKTVKKYKQAVAIGLSETRKYCSSF